MVWGSGLTEEMEASVKGSSACLHPSPANKFGAHRASVAGAVVLGAPEKKPGQNKSVGKRAQRLWKYQAGEHALQCPCQPTCRKWVIWSMEGPQQHRGSIPAASHPLSAWLLRLNKGEAPFMDEAAEVQGQGYM